MNPIQPNRRHPARGDGGSSSVEVALLTALLAAFAITAAGAFAGMATGMIKRTCADMAMQVDSVIPGMTADCR